MTEKDRAQTYEFKAEVKQLLDILARSLYTNREIFLRELISNASDALDKMRFELTRGAEAADRDLPLEIRISTDKENRRLTVSDTGVGMTREEVIENIGTIAHSGSADFLKQAAEHQNELDNIIGKFGVGFYSVFMTADQVVLKTRSSRPDAEPVEWRSDGTGAYEITALDKDLRRGTRVEIHLKEDAGEFADSDRIKQVIRKHSAFISFPIFADDEKVNTIPALWREPKSSVAQEQYSEFYKFLTYDSQDPLETLHISVDAPVQFSGLLFIPQAGSSPFETGREQHGLDLYVRRVLIQRGNKDLIPDYLGFLRGVVDAEDLPLNIARESLQENALLNKISTVITKQVLSRLQKIADEDKDKYLQFWKSHGKTFKLGYSDFTNHEKYAKLLRFNSSKCKDAQELISLDDYIERAKDGQKEIYYVFGPSREAFDVNPHMEIFKSKDLEVLYFFDPLDEFAMETLRKYRDFELKSIEHVDPGTLEQFASVELEDQVEPLGEEDRKEFSQFLDRMREILGDRVKEVRVSQRLSESPCCLVNPEGGMTSSMQKILQLASQDTSIPQKILEVNRDHRLMRNLFEIYKTNARDDYLTKAVEQLYESSLLLEGYLRDPHAMVNRIQDILSQSSGWYLAATKG